MATSHELNYEQTFHYLLGRLVHAYARFDFNLGLQFSWANQSGVDTKKLLNPTQSNISQRLEALRPMILKVYEFAGPKANHELKDWFKRADKARAIRNDFVHGRWAIPGVTKPLKDSNGEESTLELVAPNWNTDGTTQVPEIKITLGEFEKQVKEAESIFLELFSLLQSYDKRVIEKNTDSVTD